MRVFAKIILGAFLKSSEAMCVRGVDQDCRKECYDDFRACRRDSKMAYADCRRDKTECNEMCVCHLTHREYVYIEHPVRSCPPPRSSECDFVKQQLTTAPDFFHHSEWRCEYDCLTKD